MPNAGPVWVLHRDGRLSPFEPAQIAQSLFRVLESLQRPDSFLAHELTEGVIHFLAEEGADATISTTRLVEVVTQVVRELGLPTLALAYAAHLRATHERTDAENHTQYKIQFGSPYSEDLLEAISSGLIQLDERESPEHLCSYVIGPCRAELRLELEQVAQFVRHQMVFDSPEYRDESAWLEAIAPALHATGLSGVAHLNTAVPPPWANRQDPGPLFAALTGSIGFNFTVHETLERCLDQEIISYWHLSERDFQNRTLLGSIVDRARHGENILFSFDRPRRPVILSPGMDRHHPAVLLVAGISLVELVNRSGMLADVDRFLTRLGSLIRMVVQLAIQKRNLLKRHRRSVLEGDKGFLLDRARLVAVPMGLDEVVRRFTGWSMSVGGESLALGRAILQRINVVLGEEAKRANLPACLDGPTTFRLQGELVAGATPWDVHASLKSQILASSPHGPLGLFVGSESCEQLLDALELAWKETDVATIRFLNRSLLNNNAA